MKDCYHFVCLRLISLSQGHSHTSTGARAGAGCNSWTYLLCLSLPALEKIRTFDFTQRDIKLELIDTDNSSIVVTKGKSFGGIGEGKEGTLYSDRRRFDLGWKAHNAIHIS